MTSDPWLLAQDGSRKRAWVTQSGPVETGFYPMDDADTVCVSVQAGCNIGCLFCLTGTDRSTGNLTAQEITDQVRSVTPFRREGYRLGVAFQGMGEPLLNYGSVRDSIEHILQEDLGQTFRISTIGFPARIDRLRREMPFVKLQISLHTAIQAQRQELIAGSAGVRLPDLIEATARHAEVTGLAAVLNYVLLEGVNDTAQHRHAIIELIGERQDLFRVKVAEFNPHPRLTFSPASRRTQKVFIEDLRSAGIDAFGFVSMGMDVGGGCGHFNPKTAPSHCSSSGGVIHE